MKRLKNKMIGLLAIAAVGSSCWLAVNLYDSHTIKRGMPPGYHLECDGHGSFRPCNEWGPLIWFKRKGSKASAMRRAWGQYEYAPAPEHKDGGNWKPCNDR